MPRSQIDPNLPPILAEFCRLREQSGLPIHEVARLTGTSVNTLSNWIRGLCMPTLGIFEAALNSIGYELIIRKRETPGERLP